MGWESAPKQNQFGAPIQQPAVPAVAQEQQAKFPESYTKGIAEAEGKKNDKFLDEKQRGRLELKLVARVLAAQTSHAAVLSDMHAENLITKPEELNAFAALFNTAVTAILSFSVMTVLKEFKNVGKAVKALKEAEVEVKGSEVAEKIFGLNEKTVESVIEKGADKGKEKLTEKAVDVQNEPGQEVQDAKGSYITYLQDKSMMMFEHLREDRLESATDAELLCAMDAFKGSRWTHTILRAHFEHHINVYMASHAKDIGHQNESKKVQTNSGTSHVDVRKETYLAWVINGRKERQLVYLQKEFVADADHGIGRKGDDPNIYNPGSEMDRPGGAYTSEENALSLEDEGTWHDSQRKHADDPVTKKSHKPEVEPEFLGPVEKELQEAALAAQEKHWAKPPQTIMKGLYGQWIVVPQ